MAFADRFAILQGSSSFSHNIHEHYFPENPCLSFIHKISAAGLGPRWYPETHNPEPKPDILQQLTCQEILQIFVLGPSNDGKARLIECAANRNLMIRTQEDIYHAYEINGFLLQGVEVAINLWHVGEIRNSLGILRDFYQQYKTCFMMVYDVNDLATFQYVHQWISSLRSVLGGQVPIVLVGYEDTLTPKLTPVSYAEGMKAKEELELKTYYEFSDMTGPAVIEMIFDAAHIALESQVTNLDSELAEPEEK